MFKNSVLQRIKPGILFELMGLMQEPGSEEPNYLWRVFLLYSCSFLRHTFFEKFSIDGSKVNFYCNILSIVAKLTYHTKSTLKHEFIVAAFVN